MCHEQVAYSTNGKLIEGCGSVLYFFIFTIFTQQIRGTLLILFELSEFCLAPSKLVGILS